MLRRQSLLSSSFYGFWLVLWLALNQILVGIALANPGSLQVTAEPYSFAFDLETTALVVVDMQRDFVLPGGFGAALGNDVSLLQRAVGPTRTILEAARASGLFIVHTREGHRPDLTDLTESKKVRGHLAHGIGDEGPMGRILVRGEYGHGIIDELAPLEGEPVVDKPGKGAFYATDLDALLRNKGIRQLVMCGVTTEVCIQTTVREANDRGYDVLVLEDCVASYFPRFQEAALAMIKAQGGIVGWVGHSRDFLEAIAAKTSLARPVDLMNSTDKAEAHGEGKDLRACAAH